YPTQSATGNRVEQDPQDWWRATCAALVQFGPALRDAEIAAVILSGQMQDVILLGESDALGTAILYSDGRAEAQAQFLAERLDTSDGGWTVCPSKLTRMTGNAQGASSVLAKWLWLREHEARRLEACRTLLTGAHDY